MEDTNQDRDYQTKDLHQDCEIQGNVNQQTSVVKLNFCYDWMPWIKTQLLSQWCNIIDICLKKIHKELKKKKKRTKQKTATIFFFTMIVAVTVQFFLGAQLILSSDQGFYLPWTVEALLPFF